MRDLFREYIGEAEDLMPFYAHPPSALSDASNLPATPPWPASLAEEIKTYNAEMGSEVSFTGTELTVITGQQPGLFTGPLYSIYKGLTAIRLARQIEEQSGRTCVPIFWIASEDHDFEEAATAHFLTKKDEPFSLTYEPQQDIVDLPMYRVPLEPCIHEAIDSAVEKVRKSEQTEEIAAFLHDSASRSETLCEWTVRLMARMFKDTPLVLFAPHLAAARTLQADIIRHEIENPLESTRRLTVASSALSKMDFQPQVIKSEHECNFFLEVENRRCKTIFADGQFQVPQENIAYTSDQLLALLREAPERFSANVALRPIVQQRLFKAVAYVGGPSEVAYWGQLKDVFEHFRQPMPVVYPRIQCILTTTKLKKLMGKFSLEVEDLERPQGQLEQKALRNISQSLSIQKVMDAQSDIEARFRALEAGLKETDPVASEMVEAVEERFSMEFERIRDTLSRRNDKQVETVQKQLARLQNALMPWRKPQERVYTIFSFLFEHGWGLVTRLFNEIDIESFQTHEVEL
ncbi:MAG: bacillithiol biosynthesis cysteine-adding enzyme BshC [Candidatus Hydrogenedentota bacterium]